MVACLRFIITAAALFVAGPFAAGGAGGGKGSAGIAGEVQAFVDDIEYTTPYRTGMTLFGAAAAFRFYYEPSERWQFAVGMYGLRRFGDERFFSRVLPVFRARYVSQKMSFILGELVSAGAHGLPAVLYRQEYRFDPGFEEGAQVLVRTRHADGDWWVVWDSLNAPGRREHFIAGSSMTLSFAGLSFPLFIVADHAGGELFEVPGQPVQEHVGGAAGLSVVRSVRSPVRRVSGQVLALGSAYRVRSGPEVTGRGYGLLCRAGISPLGFDCSVQWFKGHDLLVPTGDPLFRSNLPVYSLEASRSLSVDDRVSLSGGIRFETEGCPMKDYFSNPRYRWWISLRGDFNRRMAP